eukprot:611840-Ditylum_brightwellii.AAC.1
MACYSLNVAVTVVTEETRSRTIGAVHIDRGMLVRLVFLIAAFNIQRATFVEGIKLNFFFSLMFFRFFFTLLKAAVTLALRK